MERSYFIELKWICNKKEINLYYIVSERELYLKDNNILAFKRGNIELSEDCCEAFSIHNDFNINMEYDKEFNRFFCTVYANREVIYCYKYLRYMYNPYNADYYAIKYKDNIRDLGGV